MCGWKALDIGEECRSSSGDDISDDSDEEDAEEDLIKATLQQLDHLRLGTDVQDAQGDNVRGFLLSAWISGSIDLVSKEINFVAIWRLMLKLLKKLLHMWMQGTLQVREVVEKPFRHIQALGGCVDILDGKMRYSQECTRCFIHTNLIRVVEYNTPAVAWRADGANIQPGEKSGH
jgi:hypothetical protein